MSAAPKALKLAIRSTLYYWRTSLAVLVGVIITTVVLAGALLVGDSVRESLRSMALMRLGNVSHAINAHGRFFDAQLGELLESEIDVPVAAALKLPGVLRLQGGDGDDHQLNHVEVIGVDERFQALTDGAFSLPDRSEVAVSRKVAAALGLSVGDSVSLRVGKPTLLPRDAPLSSRQDKLTSRGLLTVSRVVPDSALGRFSLEGSQIAPNNVFVSADWLRDKVDLPGKANLLLIGGADAISSNRDELQRVIRKTWRPEHSGIRLRTPDSQDVHLLESDRVFLDSVTTKACLSSDARAVGALTYLVNGMSSTGGRLTPYSFVVGVSPSEHAELSPVPLDMQDHEIIISRWLADALAVDEGKIIRLEFFVLGSGNELNERHQEFSVRSIVEMDALVSEWERAPAFPGLTDVESCKNWNVGLPMNEALLADEDNEAYWQEYGATPKAIVTLAAAQSMWANRFGNLSQVRYPSDAPVAGGAGALMAGVDPADLGLVLLPVRELALRGVEQSMSFGELFVSMSFFLILAAVILTGLLFVLGIQQRSTEAGVLKALGYRRSHMLLLFVSEGAVIAALGCLLGSQLAPAYTRAIIWGLGTYWKGAVAGSAIHFHQEPATLVAGTLAAFVAALAALIIAVWRQSKLPARALMAGEASGYGDAGGKKARFPLVSIALLVGTLVAVAFSANADVHQLVMIFFSAGFLLLLSGMGFSRFLLRRLACGGRSSRMSISLLGIRNAGRLPARSLTVIGLLAGGAFIVLAVSSMQEDLTVNADKPWSGTGGFALYAHSTVPVPDALDSEEARERFGMRDEVFDTMNVVSIKQHAGDDASCFNLNRAQAPILLGVNPDALSARQAFKAHGAEHDPWQLLKMKLPDGVIPALAGDANTAMWGLEKSVGIEKGGSIVYRDELGEIFTIKLVGALPNRLSVFQGRVLISAEHFAARYPSDEGYHVFLVDTPQPEKVRHALADKLSRVGLEVQPAAERLLEFYSVESSYLKMFLVLGGLGVLLGSVGLGVVLMRNVLERRNEFAVLRALGYSRSMVKRVVIAEHWVLVVVGLVIGLAAAMVAMWPNLRSSAVDVPVDLILAIVGGLLVIGLGWTALAARCALRGGLIDALRRE